PADRGGLHRLEHHRPSRRDRDRRPRREPAEELSAASEGRRTPPPARGYAARRRAASPGTGPRRGGGAPLTGASSAPSITKVEKSCFSSSAMRARSVAACCVCLAP